MLHSPSGGVVGPGTSNQYDRILSDPTVTGMFVPHCSACVSGLAPRICGWCDGVRGSRPLLVPRFLRPPHPRCLSVQAPARRPARQPPRPNSSTRILAARQMSISSTMSLIVIQQNRTNPREVRTTRPSEKSYPKSSPPPSDRCSRRSHAGTHPFPVLQHRDPRLQGVERAVR